MNGCLICFTSKRHVLQRGARKVFRALIAPFVNTMQRVVARSSIHEWQNQHVLTVDRRRSS